MSAAIITALAFVILAAVLKHFRKLPRVRLGFALIGGIALLGTGLSGVVTGATSGIGSGIVALGGLGAMAYAGFATYHDLTADRQADWAAMGSALALPTLVAMFGVSSWNLLQRGASATGQQLQQMVNGLGG